MKHKILTAIVFCMLTISAHAGYYEYFFEDDSRGPYESINIGGDIDLSLKMIMWINDTNSITAKIEKQDETGMPAGNLFIQKNSNANDDLNKIKCLDDNNRVNGNESKTFISLNNLDDILDRWDYDQMSIYGRFEDDLGGYSWVGPVVIKRKVKEVNGNLHIQLNPKEARDDGAMWRYQIDENLWSPWYESNEVAYKINTGKTKVQFKYISEKWEAPSEKELLIQNGQTTTSIEVYKAQFSSIQVMISPDEAISAGARWRAKYPAGWSEWYQSGDLRIGFNPGPVEVEFSAIDEWNSPEKRTVIVTAGEATLVTANYCKIIPYAPINVEAGDGTNTGYIKIKWDPVACIDSYDIYRTTDSNPDYGDRILSSTVKTYYLDYDAEPGVEYYYWVKAKNVNGESEFSTPDIGFKKLANPVDIIASDGEYETKIRIKWYEVKGASVYELWKNTEDIRNSAELVADNIVGTVYDDYNSIPEKKYYYWVVAKNSFDRSNFSFSDDGYGRLGVPTGVEASDCLYTDKVVITFNPVVGANSYEILYALSNKKRSRSDRYSTEPDTTYWHTTAIPGKMYYYRVRAKNPHGFSDWSAFDAGCKLLASPVLSASKRTYEDKIRISWNNINGATLYNVYKSPQDDFNTATEIMSGVIGNSFDDSTLDKTHFYYWVKAVNDYTLSEVSNSDKGYISDGCVFDFSQTQVEFDSSGGISEICVTTNDECSWDTESNSQWISLNSNMINGSSCVNYTVSENNSADDRIGSITIAGENIKINQSGLNTFILFISKEGKGTISVNGEEKQLPFKEEFVMGSLVEISATPSLNWQFNYFSGDLTDSANPLQIEMQSDMAIIAKFSPIKYNLLLSKIGTGQIFINNEETLSGLFDKGQVVAIEAKPANNFAAWDGDIKSINNPVLVTIEEDTNIIAKFDGWTLDIITEGLNLGAYYKSEVSIGVSSEKFLQSSPPKPPRYTCFMSMFLENDWDQSLSKVIQKQGQNTYKWIIAVDPHGNMGSSESASSTVSWYTQNLPSEGNIEIRQGYDGEGEVIIEDMRKINQFVISGTNEIQYFSIIWNVCNSDECNNECDPDNYINIKLNLEGEDLDAAYKYNTIVGTAKLARAISAPPKAPNYSCYMSFIALPDWESNLNEDIHNCDKNTQTWVFVANPVGNMGGPDKIGSAILTWDFQDTSSQGIFQLISGYEGDGEIIIDDMKSINQYEISGDNTDQYFRIVWSKGDIRSCFNFELEKGWNLISLPLYPDSNKLSSLFQYAEVAYYYENGSYYEAQTLNPGIGYWVKVPEDKNYEVCGDQIFHSYNSSLQEGWHLLGCISDISYPETDSEEGIEVMYEYINGSYVQIYECNPGKGFWIKVASPSDITVAPSNMH